MNNEELTPPATTPQPLSADQLVEAYIKARDARAAKKAQRDRELAEYDAIMARIEGELQTAMSAMGVSTMGTPHGTAYKTTFNSATVADPGAFKSFLERTGKWHLADIRAGKVAIREELEATGELPPGVNYSSIEKINIRR